MTRDRGGQFARGLTGSLGCGFAGVAMIPKVIVRVLLIITPRPCVAGWLGLIRLTCTVSVPGSGQGVSAVMPGLEPGPQPE